jgi:hypothetical protein
MESKLGFIITRHVNSKKTNNYWNQSVKLIRTFYPNSQIVIIDDNSNQELVESQYNYSNLTVIQSEYPKRGELLPYIYYLKYKWFPSAVIIHDSLFIHQKIPFERLKLPVLPLWHHTYDNENVNNLIRISSALSNNRVLKKKIIQTNDIIDNFLITSNVNKFNICFGGQCYIQLSFLELLQKKYNITNLVNVVHNRTDRCSLERILGLLFHEEFPSLIRIRSMFGDILNQPRSFNYTYDDYINDLQKKRIIRNVVKVWSGR